MKTVLVTGAAGYVGSQVCKKLYRLGYTVKGVDRNDPRHGYYHEFFTKDYAHIQRLLLDVDVVVHIGATSLVGPSMTDPALYYRNNVVGTLDLLDACKAQGIKDIVFASSAATYGSPDDVCSTENTYTPMNPYGWSKRMTEIMLEDYARAYNINSVSLRFFNVAGADIDGEMGQEKQATHIIARIIENTIAGNVFQLYGDDYNTPDGTNVRDYIHVDDVASGIERSIVYLENNPGAHVFNLGNKNGYSNLEIINAVKANTPLKPFFTVCERRAGDPDILISDTEPTTRLLGWEPKYTLDTIVKTAYNWYVKQNDILVTNSENKIEQITTN